jgi:hypothetical protein
VCGLWAAVIAPDGVDDAAGGDGAVVVQSEEGEDGTLDRTGQRPLHPVNEYSRATKKQEDHDDTPPPCRYRKIHPYGEGVPPFFVTISWKFS